MDLCGHATIACLGLLQERGLLTAKEGSLATRAGTVRVASGPSDAEALLSSPLFLCDSTFVRIAMF